MGKRVDVRSTAPMVRVFGDGQLVTRRWSRASALTAATTRRRRSSSICARGPGAAHRRPTSAPPTPRHRRIAGGERALPASRRPGRARPAQKVRRRPPGSRLREGEPGRRSVLSRPSIWRPLPRRSRRGNARACTSHGLDLGRELGPGAITTSPQGGERGPLRFRIHAASAERELPRIASAPAPPARVQPGPRDPSVFPRHHPG
ncbi:hypothetical protein ACWC4A_24775 [Streptomyces mirabilis]